MGSRKQNVTETGHGQPRLCNGLSRMKGNFHVRFLGEGAAAMPLPYPTNHFETREGKFSAF